MQLITYSFPLAFPLSLPLLPFPLIFPISVPLFLQEMKQMHYTLFQWFSEIYKDKSRNPKLKISHIRLRQKSFLPIAVYISISLPIIAISIDCSSCVAWNTTSSINISMGIISLRSASCNFFKMYIYRK